MTPKIRESLYYVGTIIPAVLGLFLLWGGLDAGAANHIGDVVAGVLALLGAAAPGTAAVKVRQQRKDGTFDTLSPLDQVLGGVTAIVDAKDTALAEFDKVQEVLGTAISAIPTLGPLASQVLAFDPDDIWRR
ncbi:hypothetical protein JRC04_04740 [Mycolicibacterium sp. S2-37]|uniref:hypothetical protein n=1 Tax=Mycolicibacterium sp. S2-37 TaxID=2810297 RepID=UPI001A93BCEB|nr:hypothetical protein [Mycolicibacterium sp. S2-37]MBO0676766.1 hypothetical protein [Mycolicibacterium sp. S2-37]